MWRLCFPIGPKADALEANADSARLALACRYSSSDEYEAEVISTQRAAGVYGPLRQRRLALVALAIAAALVAVALVALPL